MDKFPQVGSSNIMSSLILSLKYRNQVNAGRCGYYTFSCTKHRHMCFSLEELCEPDISIHTYNLFVILFESVWFPKHPRLFLEVGTRFSLTSIHYSNNSSTPLSHAVSSLFFCLIFCLLL